MRELKFIIKERYSLLKAIVLIFPERKQNLKDFLNTTLFQRFKRNFKEIFRKFFFSKFFFTIFSKQKMLQLEWGTTLEEEEERY